MNEILDVYIARWKLSDPRPLVKTGWGDLYTVQSSHGMAVLKLLSDRGLEDGRSGSRLLDWYGSEGAVRLLEHDEKAMLCEYADGGDLSALVRDGNDDEATNIIAGVIDKLHSRSQAGLIEGLPPLYKRYRPLLVTSDFQDAALIVMDLLAHPTSAYVLHGDIHHGNIVRHHDRGWLAIDPKGYIGERVFEAANSLCNPAIFPEIVEKRERLLRQANIMAEILVVDLSRLLHYVYVEACLLANACFVEGVGDPRHWLIMADIAAPVHSPSLLEKFRDRLT